MSPIPSYNKNIKTQCRSAQDILVNCITDFENKLQYFKQHFSPLPTCELKNN
ncbi:hypothetical protein crov464 [Cafeteria roenbergensis virus]|uniref:Uncharacterized protein n=1 Tax=Cafeteria roenbergensis virus (strain BV-PW1) TaxID=693272 RepID=E3T5N5_CROVB|nr:hypothetical protein crov464 [Cafeteria roenbergensis virus BV-PW1]ADO67498.1 hypothetical protein crov464 [Cafeteria roenbergensis virus BV-PW1]